MIKQTIVDMSAKDPHIEIKQDGDGTFWVAVDGMFESIDEFCRFVFYTYIDEHSRDEQIMQFDDRVFMRPETAAEAKENGNDEGYFWECESDHPEAIEMWKIHTVPRPEYIEIKGVKYEFVYDREMNESRVVAENGKVVARFVGEVSSQQAIEQTFNPISEE